MNVQQLRAAREAVPFMPFRIHLADGRSHPVPHRDYLSVSPSGRIVTVYLDEDAGSMLDSLMITELSFDKLPESTVGQNGAP